MFAHFRDMVESRGGSRWWNTNFAENAHISACKTTYRAGNKQIATIQPQMASNFERRRVMHEVATDMGVEQNWVRIETECKSTDHLKAARYQIQSGHPGASMSCGGKSGHELAALTRCSLVWSFAGACTRWQGQVREAEVPAEKGRE